MNIDRKEITVRQLAEGYKDNNEDGVVGFGGKLDIRPPYQREFIYKDDQRDAVINTAWQEFPLNVMYWAVLENGRYEIIDGQQRTISLCQYIEGEFTVQIGTSKEPRYFHNLQDDEQNRLLDYKLTVYHCSGTDSEKLEWFKTINISGEELADQELRNAVYHGPWVSDAKRYFSKANGDAGEIGKDYLTGSMNRQKYLETAIKWIANEKLIKRSAKDDQISIYMAQHHDDPNANELWLYFKGVIDWVEAVFPVYRKEMKGIEWGFLRNEFSSKNHDSAKLETEISTLMQDEDVTNKKGIYTYVLGRKEKHLNIRAFTLNMRREAYERQKGFCPDCSKHFDFSDMEGDHIKPWHDGGKTNAANCKMLCQEDNRSKGGK